LNVLVADGDPLFGRIVKARLEKLGYSVTIVPDGDEAWRAYERMRFRFVITEYDLAGLDGPELCRRIRNMKKSRHTYVLFYAARNDSDSIVAAYQAGADDFLGKPLNPVLLDLRLAHGRQVLNREDDLRVIANHDDTTGFIKFDTFKRFFAVHESGARRYKYQGVVTFVTIDNYNDIYRNHGQGVAVQALSMVAGIIGASIRSSDLVAHTGEDVGEFCILMPDTSLENLGKVVERIEGRVASTAIHSGTDILRPRLSYGTAAYPREGLGTEELLAPENRRPYSLSPAA
jgi:diguanylate cyclase (GGDEF)-like protein